MAAQALKFILRNIFIPNTVSVSIHILSATSDSLIVTSHFNMPFGIAREFCTAEPAIISRLQAHVMKSSAIPE